MHSTIYLTWLASLTVLLSVVCTTKPPTQPLIEVRDSVKVHHVAPLSHNVVQARQIKRPIRLDIGGFQHDLDYDYSNNDHKKTEESFLSNAGRVLREHFKPRNVIIYHDAPKFGKSKLVVPAGDEVLSQRLRIVPGMSALYKEYDIVVFRTGSFTFVGEGGARNWWYNTDCAKRGSEQKVDFLYNGDGNGCKAAGAPPPSTSSTSPPPRPTTSNPPAPTTTPPANSPTPRQTSTTPLFTPATDTQDFYPPPPTPLFTSATNTLDYIPSATTSGSNLDPTRNAPSPSGPTTARSSGTLQRQRNFCLLIVAMLGSTLLLT